MNICAVVELLHDGDNLSRTKSDKLLEICERDQHRAADALDPPPGRFRKRYGQPLAPWNGIMERVGKEGERREVQHGGPPLVKTGRVSNPVTPCHGARFPYPVGPGKTANDASQ